VCFAEQQTAGRGRLGRDWFSPRSANIYCSLLWRFPVTSPDLSGLSLAIGVMVTEALTHYGIETGIELKWPNDVMCYGRKLAGILLERLPERDGQSAVVIGIGLNVSLPEHPDRVGWIDIAEITGDPVARNALAGLLLNALLAGLPVYEQQGLSAFLPRWRELNALSGKELVVQTPAEKWFGTMVAVTERGELVVRLVDGQLKTFPWGEVSVRTRSD
jgi:BirA family biotin operon repressor/biotin-[acetyl-CoA-carboxylase] ligase